MAAYEQRSFAGAAPDSTLASGVASGALSFSVATGDGLNYPDGTGGPFYVVIDYDNSKAEKIRCTARTGDTFTVPASSGRGQDGTTAVAHDAGAKVRHCFTATDAAEANKAVVNTIGKVTTKGDLLVAPAANVLARLGVGTNGQALVADSTQTTGLKWGALAYTDITGLTAALAAKAPLAGAVLDAASTIGGVSGTTLAADRAAWTAYTPTLSNVSGGTAVGAYKLVGKTLYFRAAITAGTQTLTGVVSVGLPGGVMAASGQTQAVASANGRGFKILSHDVRALAITSLAAGTDVSDTALNGVIEVS